MSKKNKNFIKKNSDLGIKVGDWFEDISGFKHGFKYFYVVKSLNQTTVRLVKFGIDSGVLSEVYCVDYGINNFEKVKNILEVGDELELKKIGGDEARNRLKKVEGVSLILECFGVDQKKVSPQNPPSTQSTPPESKSSSHEKTKENNHSKNCVPLWKRFKDFEGKYIKLFYSGGYGIQYLKVSKVDYDSEDNEFRISGFGPYLRRGIIHNGWDWTNYVCEKERVLQEDLLQAEEISKEEFKKAEEMLREKLSHEKTVRNFLEKDKKPLTDLVGKYLKYTQDWTTFGTMYFHLKDIQIETYGDYQCCVIQYENNRFSINKKGGIVFLTGKNIQASISFESFKDAIIITEEEFNKARSGKGFKKQEKPIKIYTKEELKSSILKYTSPDGGSIYYLEHPEILNVGTEDKPGKFKNCVVSYGIIISNGGQVHFYTPKTNPFNPIVLLIESESDEGFFSRVEEIPDYEWSSLKKFYQDKIVKI